MEKNETRFIKVLSQMLNKYAMFYNNKSLQSKRVLPPAGVQILNLIMQGTNKMTDIADEIGVSKSAITQSIKKLEQKNLVEKRIDDSNNKYKVLNLTDEGVNAIQHSNRLLSLHLYNNLLEKYNDMEDESRELMLDIFTNVSDFFDNINNKSR